MSSGLTVDAEAFLNQNHVAHSRSLLGSKRPNTAPYFVLETVSRFGSCGIFRSRGLAGRSKTLVVRALVDRAQCPVPTSFSVYWFTAMLVASTAACWGCQDNLRYSAWPGTSKAGSRKLLRKLFGQILWLQCHKGNTTLWSLYGTGLQWRK